MNSPQGNGIDFAKLPPAEDAAPYKPPVWDAEKALKRDFTLSVWLSLNASALKMSTTTGHAHRVKAPPVGLAPVFDCRSEAPKGATELFVTLAPVLLPAVGDHAFMQFEFNDVSSNAAKSTAGGNVNFVSSYQVASDALARKTPPGQNLNEAVRQATIAEFALQPDRWMHWVVTVSGPTITMYLNGTQIANSTLGLSQPQINTNTGGRSHPFPLPAAARTKCGLGRSFAAAAAATSPTLSAKMMDFSVIPRALVASEVASLYTARPSQISFLLPPLPTNFRAARPTKDAHAFCPNTLKLFDRSVHAEAYSHVVLQDHILGPFTSWWQRHSLLPGLEILTAVIHKHSPRAKIYLIETWPHSTAVEGFNITSLGDRAGGTCLGAQDGWTPEEMLVKASEYFARVQQALLDDQPNVLALNYTTSTGGTPSTVPLTAENFKVIPVASVGAQVASVGGAQAGKDDDEKRKMWMDEWAALYKNPTKTTTTTTPITSTTPLLELTDPVASQAAAMPSAIGAFALATAMFVEITKLSAACPVDAAAPGSCAGYCPCNLAPVDLIPTPDAVESPEEKTRRYAKRDEVCSKVSNGVTARLQAQSHAETFTPMVSPTAVLDEHLLCKISCAQNMASEGCASASSSSTGSASEPLYPDPCLLDPKRCEEDYGDASLTTSRATDPDVDGVAPPSLGQWSNWLRDACTRYVRSCSHRLLFSLVPPVPLVIVGTAVLSTIALIIGCVYYRKKRVAWELVSTKGYDTQDKEAFDQATSLEDDQL